MSKLQEWQLLEWMISGVLFSPVWLNVPGFVHLCLFWVKLIALQSPGARQWVTGWWTNRKGFSLPFGLEMLCVPLEGGAGECPSQGFFHLLVPGPLHCLSSSLSSSWGEEWRALQKWGGQGTQQWGKPVHRRQWAAKLDQRESSSLACFLLTKSVIRTEKNMWVVEWEGFLSIPSAKEGLLLFWKQNSKRFQRKPRCHKLSMRSMAQCLLQLDQRTFQVKPCFYIHWKRGLCLPGYGSWDNCGIKISRRK